MLLLINVRLYIKKVCKKYLKLNINIYPSQKNSIFIHISENYVTVCNFRFINT